MSSLFEVDRPTFLLIYVVLMAVCIASALLVRSVLRFAASGAGAAATDLRPAEVAYLRHGTAGALQATIAGLVERGRIEQATIKSGTVHATEAIDDRLVSLGLLEKHSTRTVSGRISGATVGALFALGVLRMVRGRSLHHPVGFLLLLTGATAVVALVFWLQPPSRTRDGDDTLNGLIAQHEALPPDDELHSDLDAIAIAMGQGTRRRMAHV